MPDLPEIAIDQLTTRCCSVACNLYCPPPRTPCKYATNPGRNPGPDCPGPGTYVLIDKTKLNRDALIKMLHTAFCGEREEVESEIAADSILAHLKGD